MASLENFAGEECILEIYPPIGNARSNPQKLTGLVFMGPITKEYYFLTDDGDLIPLTNNGKPRVNYIAEVDGARTLAIQLEYACARFG